MVEQQLAGQIALLTGGTGAIGGVFARTLAKAGAQVIILGRGKTAPVQQTADEMKEGNPEYQIFGFQCDTGDEAAFSEVLGQIHQQVGMPTILINAAGGNKGKAPFVDLDTEIFQEVVQMNLLGGLVIPVKHVAKLWIDNRIDGTIINITSMTSYKPLSGVWAYNASKSAVLNLTTGLAQELAPHGIRVNAIAPGFFVGNQNRALLYEDFDKGVLTARGKSIIDRTPFGRFGKLEELAGTLLYLCDKNASGFVTGVSIPVDGGYLCNNI